MRSTLRVAAGLLLLLALAVLGALAFALQDEPTVMLQQEPAPEDVARAVSIARANDPRQVPPGLVRTVLLSERDVDVLLNHAARRRVQVATRVSLERGAAIVRASVHLPPNPFGRWLNLQARLQQTAALPELTAVQVGGLPLPAWVGEQALLQLAARAGPLEDLQLAREVLQRVGFMPQHMTVTYALRGDSAQRMVAALIPADEQQRLRAYAERLAQAVGTLGDTPTVSLAPLFAPMFALARQRSAAEGADAAAENRAVIATLALYANGRSLDGVLPAARSWPRPRPLRLTLAGREDFPLHLLLSAALASEGTSPLSRAIGIYKEVADSRGGTGFSFNDMAANRAGTRIGEMAVAQPRKLQEALARGVQESDILPAWADLPEFLPEPEFKRRFGGVGAPAYLAMLAEIDRRVDALPVLR